MIGSVRGTVIERTPSGEAQVMMVNSESKVEPRSVKAEQSIGDKWVVTEGLAAGDRVIVEGLQKVKPGAPVQAQEAGSVPDPAPPAITVAK